MRLKLLPVELTKITCKAADASAPFRFSGYLSSFGNVDSYGDVILPGAFSETLSARDWPVQLFYNHRGGAIGKYLSLAEDEYGLNFEAELTPGHSIAKDVEAGMRHGAIRGMSIGFAIPTGGATSRDPEKDPAGWRGLNIAKISLYEGSVVDMPANVLAEVEEMRRDVVTPAALLEALEGAKTIRESEEALRGSLGLSRRAVEVLSAHQKNVFEGPLLERIAAHEKTIAALRIERELAAFAGRVGTK